MSDYIVAVTGASGSLYAERIIKALLKARKNIRFLITEPGRLVVKDELGWELPVEALEAQRYLMDKFGCLKGSTSIKYFDYRDIGAQIASGSAKTQGMIIIPCSMSTLSGIACGASNNLVERAADVMLKEKKPLIVVPRETPLNTIHLRNMLTLAEAGASIVPAMPAFYHRPESIADLADFIAGRVLDLLQIEHKLFNRWEGLR